MTADTLTITGSTTAIPDTAAIIDHGWKVYRRASDAAWPEETRRDIGKAVTDLWTALEKYGRLREDENWTDMARLAASYAAQVSQAADRVEEYLMATRGETR